MTTRTAPPLSETPIREVRRFTAGNLELRAGDDGMLTFTGYASVFDAPYDMYGGPDAGGWTEVVDPGAFRKTLSEKPDVQLLVNHEDLPLARTKSGTMKLSDDNTGLYVEATLDPNDPDVAALVPKVQRGDLDEIPGVTAATVPYDGQLLVYDLVNRWWLRDYRRHQSVPLAFRHHADHASDLKPTWLWDGLLLTVEKQGLLFIHRKHPSEAPTPVPNSSCSSDQPTRVYGIGKTALVYCLHTGEMIAVKPGRG